MKHHLFFGGDSGYGQHVKEIEAKLGGFDLVMLDSGQYDPRWPYIHMTPEESMQAAQDLDAKRLYSHPYWPLCARLSCVE